jgi:SNF2 family DNA or RNA helicase
MTLRYRPRTEPYAHQASAAIRAVRHGNLAFLMEPGTGKTKAAIDAAIMQHLRGRVDRVAVLCPLSAIDVWRDELDLHMPEEFDRKIKWRAINYDKISRRDRQGSRWVYPYVAKLERFNPDLIVLDESHRCKRASSNRGQALWRMVQRLRQARGDGRPYVYLLTGTPHPKGWIDLFAQFRIMDDAIFGTNLATFKDLYCEYGFGKRRWTITRYRRVDEIKEIVRSHSYIISKDKALDLPPQVWQNVPVRMPAEGWAAYNEMVEELLTELPDGSELSAANAGVARMRLLQITGGYTTDRRQIHEAKIKTLRDLLEDLHESDEQVVVYCRFLAEVAACVSAGLSVGYHTVGITGATKRGDRTKAIHEFQKGGQPTCLVFQADTGSLAITLTNASEAIYYSLPDAWDTYRQTNDRIHRIGQDRKVRYRHLIVPGTVDVSVLRSLRSKSDMHRQLMRNKEAFFRGI